MSSAWRCAYALDEKRRPVSGSETNLADAIRRGADLRIYTEFRHNEHIDTESASEELIQEVADFRVTYLMDDHWTAGIINLRQPISLPDRFGPRPSMSFFLYNQDGRQAIARPYLDGAPSADLRGASPLDDHSSMPRYHQIDGWDRDSNAPSSNFEYDFETYRFWVNDVWKEVLSHDENGAVISGSIKSLEDAFARGQEVKVGIRGLCTSLARNLVDALDHEVFVQVGSCYYYTERKLFIAAAHPVVRVKPTIPVQYESEGWDFGWLMPRTDGLVASSLIDPYTLSFRENTARHSIRWFVH
jgi:hypothetical protein